MEDRPNIAALARWPFAALSAGVRSYLRLCRVQSTFWMSLPGLLYAHTDPIAPDRRRLRVELSELRHLLDTALSAGVDQDFYHALNALANNRRRIERAIVVWVDLIEVLVQFQERRYGPRAGLGRLKSLEVKRVLRILLLRQKLPLPAVPDYLVPLIVEYAADWIVEAVVVVSNKYGLWEPAPQRRGYPLRVFLGRMRLAFRHAASLVARPLVRMFLWMKHTVEGNILLGPEVKAALDAVEREGTFMNAETLIRDVIRLMQWAMSHRTQLAAGVQLVFAAVQEAERYGSLTGPEKKQYARSLVFAVIDDLGFVQKAGLLFAVVDSMVTGTIESAVTLFNKRGVFSHS